MTVKRGEGRPLFRWRICSRASGRTRSVPQIERRSHLRASLALTLLEQVLTRLGAEYKRRQTAVIRSLKRITRQGIRQPSQAKIAAEMR